MRLGKPLRAGTAFALVGDQDHLGRSLAQPARETLVERQDSAAGIDQEQDDIRSVDRPLGEAPHAGLKGLAARGFPPCRIEQHEGEIAELRRLLAHVAGDTGRVVDDGAPTASQTVEERRLADVGATDDGDPTQPLGW